MTKLPHLLLATVLLGIVGAAPASAPTDFARQTHAVIAIDKDGAHPAVMHMKPDEVVGWLNYSDATAQIVFPDDVADAFTCSNVRPSFYRTGGGQLISRPIGPLEFVQPCQLAPGTYHYGVIFSYGVGGLLAYLVPTQGQLPDFEYKGEIQVK